MSRKGWPVNSQLTLLLNLAVLIVTVIVVVAHADSQERVLRATTRMVCDSPLPRDVVDRYAQEATLARQRGAADGAIGGAIGQVSHIRLLKYLSRVDGLEALSPGQLEAVYEALEDCCRVLVEAGVRVRRTSTSGARARSSAEAARERAEQQVTRRLRAAAIPEGELLARLVRVVVSSAG